MACSRRIRGATLRENWSRRRSRRGKILRPGRHCVSNNMTQNLTAVALPACAQIGTSQIGLVAVISGARPTETKAADRRRDLVDAVRQSKRPTARCKPDTPAISTHWACPLCGSLGAIVSGIESVDVVDVASPSSPEGECHHAVVAGADGIRAMLTNILPVRTNLAQAVEEIIGGVRVSVAYRAKSMVDPLRRAGHPGSGDGTDEKSSHQLLSNPT